MDLRLVLRSITSCFLLMGIACVCAAQPDLMSELVSQSRNERSHLLQEKIFVHTDRSFYMTGEIVWCKIYCVEGSSHIPLDESKVAYIELLDRENKAVWQGKIAIDSGLGNGSFYLAPSINSGIYRLRAYTNWMKNLGPGSYFERSITVVNPFKHLGAENAGSRYEGSVGLFPEGGNLVAGIHSRIGFEITDAAGNGAEGKGWIVDDAHDTVVQFRPLHRGIGNFWLTPLPGRNYQAVVELDNGTILRKDLAESLPDGYVMQVSDGSSNKVGVKVLAKNAGKLVYLVIKAGDKKDIIRAAGLLPDQQAGNDTALFIINKDELGKGVNRMTLLDPSGMQVCERLYAILPEKELLIQPETDKISYGRREAVQVSLESHNASDNEPLETNLSMAVYRLDSLERPEGSDIRSYLWLTSDCRGTIESPQYYFSNAGQKVTEALDNLMLTHGWRRFRGRDLPPAASLVPPEHRGQLITGRLLNVRTGKPAGGIVVFLSVPGINFLFASASTDSTGKFIFDIKDFYGSGGILLQTNTAKGISYKVEMNSPYSEQYDGDPLPVLHEGEPNRNLLSGRSLDMQLENIYYGDSLNKLHVPYTDSLRFFGKPDHSYKLDDYVRFTTMEEVLREYVREINVNHLDGLLHPVMLNEPDRRFFDDNNALILLDGIPLAFDKIFSYDPLKVEKLDIISRSYILGPCDFSGIASFTTYKGDYEGVELDARSLLIDYDGLQPQREFYMPPYGARMDGQSSIGSQERLPDHRSVLYWAPDIRTDVSGKQSCRFYTSDLPGKYVLVVQGLTKDGRIGVAYRYFEVR